ncbi:transcription factor MYB114-like [Phalaenopsis equestris]|uniref:transcription factor MYB114-like n=1 Tax=Phalaenopsis equestris TaxID=78828 RepID=UPI0009E5BDE2|nr:transcription factor MYB114-like [Phalaenopsis equestris]
MSEEERLSRRNTLWSPEEDEVLRKHVAEHGEYDWGNAEELFKRPRKACYARWRYGLRTTVTQHPLTDEEKTILWQLYEMLGANWAAIRRRTKGDNRFSVPRTEFDIRNYIYQVELEKAREHGFIPDDVNVNDGNLEAPGQDIDRHNEQGSSHGNQSLDLSLSLRVSPSAAGNFDINAPAPSNDAQD